MSRTDIRCYQRVAYLCVFAVVLLLLMLSGPDEGSRTTTEPPLIRTIVAYSLESQLELERRDPIVCLPLHPPGSIKFSNRYWQRTSTVYLYSAYLDDRLHARHYVRVLGMREGNKVSTLYCQLWYTDHGLVLQAIEKEMWVKEWDSTAPNSVFRPIMISCPLPNNNEPPTAVSISENQCGSASTFFRLNTVRVSHRQHLAVCVKGLDLLNDESIRLAEWLELNVLFGAERILVYKYQVHPNVSRVLDYYSKIGVAQIIPLTIPGKQHSKDIWQKRRNEIVPYNDCLYRCLKKFHFVLPIDIDEVIVPVKGDSWLPLLTEEFPPLLDKFSSFSVRNAYFFDEFPVDDSVPKFLHTMRHTIRSANFSREEDSVKSFVSTKNALTVFNHFAIKSLYPGTDRNMVLKLKMVQMNHYKAKCSPELVEDCATNFLRYRKRDDLILKFRKLLEPKLTLVLKSLGLI